MDVVVTDHHAPRADGALPDAPIVHPRIGGYPCPDLCAAGVAYKLAQALLAGAGEDPAAADEDLDLVALATVADVVSLHGREPAARARRACGALAGTRKPGLQALMDVARVDPSGVDEGAIGFRLAPRLNAAGRLYRADAGLELAAHRRPRARPRDRRSSSTPSTPSAATSRPASASRPRRCWPSRARPARPRYVLAAEGWHPGVIGIVAAAHRRAPPPPDRPDRARRRRGLGLRPLDPGLRPARRAAPPAPTSCSATAATAPPPA